jgi:hypothetical protein
MVPPAAPGNGRTACGYAEFVISPSRLGYEKGGRRAATLMNWVPLMGDREATGQE